MRKLSSIARYALSLILLFVTILLLAGSIYDFCTINHAPLFVKHNGSYIKSVSQENDSLKLTVVLCIKNIRYEQIACDKLVLLLWGKNGDQDHFDTVVAEPKDPNADYISFPGLRSKTIECTFSVSDFGAPLSIDDIDISASSTRKPSQTPIHSAFPTQTPDTLIVKRNKAHITNTSTMDLPMN